MISPKGNRVASASMASKHLHVVFDRDGGAILDIAAGRISTLNSTGAFIWDRLRRSEPLELIVASLAKETGEFAAIVERDVKEFIEELNRNGLLPS